MQVPLEQVRLVPKEKQIREFVKNQMDTGKGFVYGWIHGLTDESDQSFPGNDSLNVTYKGLW